MSDLAELNPARAEPKPKPQRAAILNVNGLDEKTGRPSQCGVAWVATGDGHSLLLDCERGVVRIPAECFPRDDAGLILWVLGCHDLRFDPVRPGRVCDDRVCGGCNGYGCGDHACAVFELTVQASDRMRVAPAVWARWGGTMQTLKVEACRFTIPSDVRFPNLRSCTISCAPDTERAVTPDVMPNLQSLEIKESFSRLPWSVAGFSELTHFRLANCQLIASLDLSGLPKLSSLKITDCYSLRSLIVSPTAPPLEIISLARCGVYVLPWSELPCLLSLAVTDCPVKLDGLVAPQLKIICLNGCHGVSMSAAPAVTSLQLQRCSSLSRMPAAAWPALTNLHLEDCPALEEPDFTPANFPALKNLRIHRCRGLMMYDFDLPALKTLSIARCQTISWPEPAKLESLESLVIEDAVYHPRGRSPLRWAMPKLKRLEVGGSSEIFAETGLDFPVLEFISISRYLLPTLPESNMPSLAALALRDCPNLTAVPPSWLVRQPNEMPGVMSVRATIKGCPVLVLPRA
jgi:hypothetical protein